MAATLRLATPADLPLLVRHRRLMWADIATFTPEELDAADAPYERWAAQRLASGALAAWIAEREGRAVASGCVWLQPVQPRPGRPFEVQPYLLSMYTEPAERGKGHAPAIVRAALAWAEARGHPFMSLHASEFGRPIYEKLGFERTWEMRATLKPAATRTP